LAGGGEVPPTNARIGWTNGGWLPTSACCRARLKLTRAAQ
jgi:hypothetical protein